MKQGVVVYEIIVNANKVILNGIYANDGDGGPLDRAYEVNNEIAKKKLDSKLKDDGDILVGEYDLRYIDSTLVNGTLTIEIEAGAEAYKVSWFKLVNKKPTLHFIGIALKAGERHLAVSYLNVTIGKKA